jgi:hypothetical protein
VVELNRRRLLAGGVAALAVAGVGLAAWPGAQRPAPDGLRVLSPAEWSTIAALAEAVLDVSSEDRPTAATVDVATLVDAFLDRLHPATANETRTAVQLLENGLSGFVLDRRLGPFSRQSLGERRRIVRTWQTSRLSLPRTVIKALVGLVLASYWSDPRTFPFVGYPS